LVLQTANGDRLLASNTRFQPAPSFEQPVSRGTVECDLGSPPLMPGRYFFSLWLGDMGGDHHIELEALQFEVTERDLWGIGRLPPAEVLMWWPTVFRLTSAESTL
jgi:hypothetical protein